MARSRRRTECRQNTNGQRVPGGDMRWPLSRMAICEEIDCGLQALFRGQTKNRHQGPPPFLPAYSRAGSPCWPPSLNLPSWISDGAKIARVPPMASTTSGILSGQLSSPTPTAQASAHSGRRPPTALLPRPETDATVPAWEHGRLGRKATGRAWGSTKRAAT